MLHRRSLAALLLTIATLVACRGEQPATNTQPPASTATTATTATAAPPVITGVATATAPLNAQTYESAARWYGATHGFHFTMKTAGFAIEGDMERTTPGAERVRFTHQGAEWIGAAERTGVIWYKRANGSWTKATPPPFADMAFQRATLWFDPQKKEGEAQKTGDRSYRFTDANSGSVYDVSVDEQGRIASVDVSGAQRFAMTITKADVAANIEKTGK